MHILAVDVGTGTQDILLFDSDGPIENSPKMVLPSPTAIAATRIRRATAARQPLLLDGTIAGGGPCSWALEDHLRAGLPAFATPDAARTVDDDLDRVRALGVTIISDDEAVRFSGVRVTLRDLDLDAIRAAFAAFEVPLAFDGIAVACLDHGDAPPGTSDRTFRFDHLARTVRARNDLLAFATAPADLPPYLTRARAVVEAASREAAVAFMDTGPAAALGALHDERVAASPERLVLNLGNMHLLGFHLRGRTIASLFEHHTGEVSNEQVEAFTRRLADGSLQNDEVFSSKGHGALHVDRSLVGPALPSVVAVTGPQRGRLAGSALHPTFAAPFGDMMIGGCFGLLRAFAEVHPWAREPVDARLGALAA
jgi:uncharacterized protein (DUF1786 family)